MIRESRDHHQSLATGSRRASSPVETKARDKKALRSPRRVSIHDENGVNDDPDMRVFQMKVYYSEAAIDSALKTYPQTKMAAIVSPVHANRSNFVSCIRKKLTAIGLNPDTRLTLTPVPRVPDHRDYNIAEWLSKYPGAAMIVSPEDKRDTVYHQLINLKGQGEPDYPPKPIELVVMDDPSIPSPPPVEPAQGSSRGCRVKFSSGSGSSRQTRTRTVKVGRRQEAGQGSSTITSRKAGNESSRGGVGQGGNTRSEGIGPATPSCLASPHSGASSTGAMTTTDHDVVETSRLELRLVKEKLCDAASHFSRLEDENASKDVAIRVLKEKVEDFNYRLDEVEGALTFTRTKSYAARLREVYRQMFLECARKRVRAKLKALFKFPPSPVDYLLVSYDKVLTTCQVMEDLQTHVGLSLADLKLTEEHASTSRPVVHSDEHVHIGVYAEMAHNQDPRYLPAYRNLFFFLFNQEPVAVLDNLISSWT